MASGNPVSEHVLGHDGNKGELERVKEHLQEVTKKNQDLEEMLLYTTQELQKEKENSRKIVLTLTERLMESREMINKLEVENMRYKKDCMLAVELLQCNRSVDQGRVSSTIRKLSEYTVPVEHHNSTSGNPFVLVHDCTNINKTTKDADIKNSQPTRPRTASKKKNNPEGSSTNEDTTALLDKQDTNEDNVKILGRQDKIIKDTSLEYNKDLRENQCEETTDKTLSSMIDNSQQKQFDNPQDIEGMNGKGSTQSKDRYSKEEKECLTKECGQEGKPVIANIQSEITDNQLDLNSVEHEGSNMEDSCPKEKDVECLNEEWTQEDKPLIANETGPSTEQSLSTPEPNVKSRGENPHTVNACQAESKNTGYELHGDVRQSTSFISTTAATIVENKDSSQTKAMKEDAVGNENEKLLDAERSEENHTQQISSETNTAASERTLFAEDDNNKAEDNQAETMVSIGDGGKLSSMDDSTTKESETNDGQVDGPVVEADDETSTAEENTPLV